MDCRGFPWRDRTLSDHLLVFLVYKVDLLDFQAFFVYRPLQKLFEGYPGGPVVKTLSFQAGGQVQSLVEKIRSHVLCGTAKSFFKNTGT